MNTFAFVHHSFRADSLLYQIIVYALCTSFGKRLIVIHLSRVVRMTYDAEVRVEVSLQIRS